MLVFPAPAGMNREATILILRRLSVPRACGDEPSQDVITVVPSECSPRLRG